MASEASDIIVSITFALQAKKYVGDFIGHGHYSSQQDSKQEF